MTYLILSFYIYFAVLCARLAYLEYKTYIDYKKCTQKTQGVLNDLYASGGLRGGRRITGRLSFTTLNGKIFTIKYNNELFKGAPRIDNGAYNKEIPVVIMYDPTAPGVNYYIKNYYRGKRTFIAYTITSLLFFVVTLVMFL